MVARHLTLLLLNLCAACCAAERFYLAPDAYNPVAEHPLDKARAVDLYDEATQAVEQSDLMLAMQLVHEVLQHDPDHAQARHALGYQKIEGRWQTPYEAKQSKRGYRWSRRLGWYKPANLARLEAGERPYGKRWIDSETDAQRHTRIEDGWQIRSDHFVVTTNHSVEAGAQLAAELEALRQVWQQALAGYDLTERELRARFHGERSAPKPRRPMRVFYHRNKTSYVEHLRRRQPRIAETLGIYFDTRREAHFYHADDPSEAARLRATLYHEATHQWLQECSPKARSVGENANFWVVEGIACYFETLVPGPQPGRYTLGDPTRGRLPSARRLAQPMPIDELTSLGMSDLQRRDDLPALYAQSTALVAMLYEQDASALVAYLRAVYSGRPDASELMRHVGRDASRLDAEYRQYVETESRQTDR